MRNRDKPASPATTEHTAGLTKREAAAIAMTHAVISSGPHDCTYQEQVADGVRLADALFDELEKGDG